MKRLFSFLLVVALMVTVFAIPTNATLVEYMYGDVTQDDSIDVIDATAIQLHLAGVNELVSINLAIADFDNDKEVSILDATKIQQYNAELIDNPRGTNNYIEFYVDIEDITIEPAYDETVLYADKSIKFTVNFDEVYNPFDDNPYVYYDFIFTGVTDETYYETSSSYDSRTYVTESFPSAGIYEVKVVISKWGHNGTYTYTKQFEVLPAIVYDFEFDQKRFVEYKYSDLKPWEFPSTPEDASTVEYEMLVDAKAMDLDGGYGFNPVSEYFVALVHTKEEYDKLFNIDNDKFDEEFFETKSLVVAVSPGFDHYDYSSIESVSLKGDVLYIQVVYGNSYPVPGVSHPTAPTWYSFAAVDKVYVENITSVQRVS